MTKAISVHIHGRVQGVYYRATARQQALYLNLAGWVKNEGDGSVKAHLQGEDRALDNWLQWARQGPKLADVSKIDVSETTVIDIEGFEVR